MIFEGLNESKDREAGADHLQLVPRFKCRASERARGRQLYAGFPTAMGPLWNRTRVWVEKA